MQEREESSSVLMHCPECGEAFDIAGAPPYAKIACPHCAVLIRVRTAIGQYEIVGLLGEGGMSQVFRALDRHLGREVALKILHQSLSRDESLAAMFEREAKLTASIVHPNVVKVFSVGQDQGYFFIAMELLQATSLEQLIASQGGLAEDVVLRVALDVARGLKAAREEQLIHRDIKPGNMLVTGDGTTKLVDFGLALQQGGEDVSDDLWATPFYVPPEKLDGAPDTFLGDIYSLGATLYHALAGKPPFDANTSSMEELKEIKRRPIDLKAEAPAVSRATVKLVESMMSYRQEDRIPSYDEIIARVEEIRRRQFAVEPSGRGRTRNKRLPLFAGAGALLLVAAAAGWLLQRPEPMDDGDLEIGDGERLITTGENSVTGRFLSGREKLAEGKFAEAEEIFASLATTGETSASTRIWSHFFLGTIRLFQGESALSRESFREVLAIVPEPETVQSEGVVFMKRAAVPLAEPLPVLAGDADFAADGLEALGLLAVGLKNWQDGELTSAETFLRAFSESHPPANHPWLAKLKGRVAPFLADLDTIRSLPNPAAASSEAELASQAEALRQGAEALLTRGAAPRLVKRRFARAGSLGKLAANRAAAEKRAAETPEKSSDPRAMEAPVGEGAPAPPSAEEQADIDALKGIASSLAPLSQTLRFSTAAEQVGGASMATPLGLSLRDELARAYASADTFLAGLTSALAASPFEGTVRRRVGRDLEATVSAQDPSVWIVDLGFGPNEVGVEEFAPDWLLQLGEEKFPPPSAENSALWASWIHFGLLSGSGDRVEAKAGQLGVLDPDFAGPWSLLRRLR